MPPQQPNSTQNPTPLTNKMIHQEDNFQRSFQEKINENSLTESNEEFERNKFLAGFRNKYISDLNIPIKRNESNLSLNKSNEVQEKCEVPLFCETSNGENFDNMVAYMNAQPPNTNKSNIEAPNISRSSKPTKPIKRISLGKHKNAIQQIDTPVKLNDFIPANGPVKEQNIYKNTNLIDTKINELKMPSLKNCDKALTKFTTTSNISNLLKNKHFNFLQISEKSVPSNSSSIKMTTLGHPVACNNTIFIQNQLTLQTTNNLQVPTSTAPAQGLFHIPVNMMPVRVLPHTSSQHAVSKTVNLQSSNLLKKNQIPRKDTEISKRIKGRRKTVKELLQERQRSSDPRKSQSNKREIKVLRPLCKIPIAPDTQQKASINIQSSARDCTKRPNIMILPSASKPNNASEIQNRKKPFILNVSPLDITLSPFCKSSEKGKSSRPRYYDLSELQIGYFKVEDDVDSTGRFKSKFKVIFTKCQFLYDFPVSNCNQPELKKTEFNGQMARITIPFKSILSMSMRDRIIYICLNDTPQMSLGMITSRSGKFFNVYDTDTDFDSKWRDFLRNTLTHKVVLRKRQAGKLKMSLCQFDKKFISLTNISVYGHLARDESDPYVIGNEMSPRFHQTNSAKNKKSCIRRLPQWDADSEEKAEDILMNQVCSCRTNCRYVRCSCVKAAKSCSFSGSMCQCINCNNPLNVLETIGMDVDFSIQDTCLFQNIYQIPELLNYLQREVRLECCKSFARVQDCIPGTVLCPNIDCNARLEFSWCHRIVCYPENNPRNHCSFCGQCRFSNKYHCLTCKRCYVVTTKSISCPRCQKEEVVNAVISESKKQSLKPEIIVLQSSLRNTKEMHASIQSS